MGEPGEEEEKMMRWQRASLLSTCQGTASSGVSVISRTCSSREERQCLPHRFPFRCTIGQPALCFFPSDLVRVAVGVAVGAGGSDLRPEEIRQFVLELETTHEVCLSQSSGSSLLLEDFTRPGSHQCWGQMKGGAPGHTQSSFWSGIPGSRGTSASHAWSHAWSVTKADRQGCRMPGQGSHSSGA